MKVVQINGAAKNGSTGRIVSQLSDVMIEEGIENYIIASGYKEKCTRKNVFFYSSFIGVKLHQILGFIFGDAGFHSSFATRKVINILKKMKPDIVHLHHIYGYWLNVSMLLKYLRKSGTTVVWTIHDFWAITGHCTHFEAIGCVKWQSCCDDCPQTHAYPYSIFLDRSKQLYERKKKLLCDWSNLNIVTVSHWVRECVGLSYLDVNRIKVIPNGIDFNIFHRREVIKSDELKGKYIILSVAMTWSKNKGLSDLISLAKMLAEDELIVLIGLSPEIISALPERMIGLTRTENTEELCKYYNMADVYVSASIEETMGMTVAEAMACGTPAVVYENTALAELIEAGCGAVAKRGVEQLYWAIHSIREKGKENYSATCVEHIASHYEKKQQYRRYCDYYKEALSGESTNGYKYK